MIGIGLVHPLIEIRDYIRKSGSNSFYAYELAGFLRLSEEQAQIMLINLANSGFCEYDLNTNFCVTNEKLNHYIQNSAGRRDYDVLQFNSTVDGGNNAQLNLLNYNLLLKGLDELPFQTLKT